jgi:hypothetical protein
VVHGTINLTLASPNGQSLDVHFVTHVSWTPGTDPGGLPHTAFDKITCP